MNIKVHLAEVLALYANHQSVVKVTGDTIKECLEFLITKYPELRELVDITMVGNRIRITLNQDGEVTDLSKPVNEGDEISIMLHVG